MGRQLLRDGLKKRVTACRKLQLPPYPDLPLIHLLHYLSILYSILHPLLSRQRPLRGVEHPNHRCSSTETDSAVLFLLSTTPAIPLRGPHDPITQRPSSRPADAHAVGKQTLSLTSWNIQASQSRPAARSELILDHIFKGPKFPDIIFLQEVASSARESLLSDSRVRSSFLTTDAEDHTSFKGVPFATMTLLSSKRFGSSLLAEEEEGEGEGEGGSKMVLDSVFRTELPSRYKRDALCVNIAAPATPGAVLRLLNVHLDSLDSQFRRALQMYILAGLLREPGCSGGIIAGDFNAIHPDDLTLVDKHELVDAWVALHGSTTGPDGGAPWGVGVELKDGLKPGRLDKVVMLGLQPDEIEVLQPGLIDAYTPWSDHCGLRCTFTI